MTKKPVKRFNDSAKEINENQSGNNLQAADNNEKNRKKYNENKEKDNEKNNEKYNEKNIERKKEKI